MPLNFGEVGTDCVREAQRTAIQAKVYEKAAALFAEKAKPYLPPNAVALPNTPRTFVPPKLIEDYHWPKRVLGECHPIQGIVRLNMPLLCDAESYEDTLTHETAHYVATQLLLVKYGQLQRVPRRDVWAQPHGQGWQYLMRKMGREPSRTGVADLSTAYPKQYAGMTCACGRKQSVGRRKPKNVVLKNGFFVCKCGTKIETAMFKGASRDACKYGRTKRGTCRRKPR